MGNVTNNNIEKNDHTNIEHIRKTYYWRNAFHGLVILLAGIIIGGASMSIFTTHRLTSGSRRNGMGTGARRGNEAPGQRGGRRQRELLRRGTGPSATPPSEPVNEPNMLRNGINKNKIEAEELDPNLSE